MLELAGLPIPENMDGVSLLPLLNNPKTDVREQLALMNLYGPEATRSFSVVTKTSKFNYWWYGDDEMDPTEELFDLANDPLELTNAALDPNAATQLASMRRRYDTEVKQWQYESVDYNDYQRYGTLFDRTVPMDQKEHLIKGPRRQKKKKAAGTKPKASKKAVEK